MDTTKLPTEWNLTHLLKESSDKEIEKQKQELTKQPQNFAKRWKKKDFTKNPQTLKLALDDYEKWQRNFGVLGNIGYYFELKYAQNQLNPKIKAQYNQVEELAHNLINETQFFTLQIAKIPKDRQNKFLNFTSLSPYKHFLEKLFKESQYLLSEPEEKILNLKSITSHSNWIKMTQTFLSQEEKEIINDEGKKEKANYSKLGSLMNSQKKSVRDSAAKAFNEILSKYVETAETEMNSILTNKKIDDQLRGISRPDLTRHLSDDLDSQVVDILVKSVSSRFKVAQRYYKLKAKLLGVKKLKYHERNVDYGKLNNHYPYPQAVKLILKVLTSLDSEFGQIFNQFVSYGLLDVYPQKGKRGGAACFHNLITQPTYIILNHANKLTDVLTIAHETGHGINNELMRKTQNALNFETPLSTAEVASTFMEDFVLEEILKTADQEEKLAIMMMKLNDEISTVFRQIACYNFETELHQSLRKAGYLSKEEIGKIFQKHMSSYMGTSVEQSPGSENWWVYWPHLRTFFYVYTYSSGLLISKSLQAQVKKDPQFIDQVKKFLSSGSSKSPINIFKSLGIDITQSKFWDQGLEEINNLLSQTERLAKTLGKI